jgi:pyruvate kinase
VIWATQVLERLSKEGRPSRAEVSDAALAVRAECVMLNKGPYIAEAVRLLDGVLLRMQNHQDSRHMMASISWVSMQARATKKKIASIFYRSASAGCPFPKVLTKKRTPSIAAMTTWAVAATAVGSVCRFKLVATMNGRQSEVSPRQPSPAAATADA